MMNKKRKKSFLAFFLAASMFAQQANGVILANDNIIVQESSDSEELQTPEYTEDMQMTSHIPDSGDVGTQDIAVPPENNQTSMPETGNTIQETEKTEDESQDTNVPQGETPEDGNQGSDVTEEAPPEDGNQGSNVMEVEPPEDENQDSNVTEEEPPEDENQDSNVTEEEPPEDGNQGSDTTEGKTPEDGTEVDSNEETDSETEDGEEKDKEEIEEKAALMGSVTQQVIRTEIDGQQEAIVKYTLTVSNMSEEAASEETKIKAVLPETLTYYASKKETAGIETAGREIYWNGQAVSAASQNTYIFCAKVAKGVEDTAQLAAAFYIDSVQIDAGSISWNGAELLKIEEKEEEEGPTSISTVCGGVIITVSAEPGVLKPGTEVAARRVSTAKAISAIENGLDENQTVESAIAFDVVLKVDGQEVQPDDTVQVTFANIPFAGEAQEESKELVVVHVDDGMTEATDMGASVVSADMVAIETTHFSVYAVAVIKNQTHPKPDITEKYNTQNSFTYTYKDSEGNDQSFSSLAFDFHLFGTDVSINNHTNGNIAANVFNGSGSAFGTNQNKDDHITEYNYFGTSASGVGQIADGVVIIGNGINVSLQDNGNAVIIGDNSSKQDGNVSKNVYQEREGSEKVINIEAELSRLKNLSAGLAKNQNTAGVKYDKPADMNSVTKIDVSGSNENINYLHLDAVELMENNNGKRQVLISGVENKTLVINVDMTNATKDTLGNLVTQIEGYNNGEYVTKSNCNLLWNFYQKDANGNITTYTYTGEEYASIGTSDYFMGTILAPGANVTYGAVNGTIIGQKLKSTGKESHNWRFTGLSLNITVNKTLKDDNSSEAKTFYFALFDGTGNRVPNQRVVSVTLSNGQTASASFPNLKSGVAYRVYETDASGNILNSGDNGYIITGNGQTVTLGDGSAVVDITNRTSIENKTSVSGSKTWNVPEGTELPESITVELLQNGKTYATKTVSAKDEWKYEWTDLPLYSADGKTKYSYSIQEVKVEGYETKVEGYDLINTLTGIVDIDGEKNWVDNEDSDNLRPEEIEVVLLRDGTEIKKQTVSAENNWKYAFHGLDKFTPDGQREYHYSVKEAEVPDGYTAEVKGYDITNTRADSAKVIVEGTKSLTGRSLIEGEFTFLLTEVTDAEGKETAENGEVLEAVNGEDGKFRFAEIAYTKPGEHFYRVIEENSKVGGITYDNAQFIVKVTVSSGEGGKLLAEMEYLNGEISFTNSYKASGSAVLETVKVLNGKDALSAGEFFFQVYEVMEDGTRVPVLDENNNALTVSNDAEGKVIFSEITFTHDNLGVHNYEIMEVKGNDPAVTYDEAPVKAIITVEDENNNGTLDVAVSYPENDHMFFTNDYHADGSVTFTGRKELLGNRRQEIKAGEFTFSVIDKATGEEAAEGTVKDDGIIEFTPIHYTEAHKGTHTYVITENTGEDKNIEYQTEPVEVIVEVKDNADGTLEAEAQYQEGGMVFTNKYHAKGELVLDTIQKTLDGGIKLDENQFAFQLKDEEGNVLQTVSNKADGTAVFESLKYTEEDIDKEYIYTVSEAKDETAGITFDETVYTIHVKVEDSEESDGTLKITSEILNGTDAAAGMTFVNRFAGSVTLTKKGTDERLLAGAQYQLYTKSAESEEWIVYTADYADGIYTSDAEGEIRVENLPANDYRFVEVKAPEGYLISDTEHFFTIGNDGEAVVDAQVDAIDEVGETGSIQVTKRVTGLLDFDMVDMVMADATFYVNLFTDPAGTRPYRNEGPKAIHLQNQSSSTVTFDNLANGIYYVFETDADGNVIPMDELTQYMNGEFVCMVDGESNEVQLDLKTEEKEGYIALNNCFYTFPEGATMEAWIEISKTVLSNGEVTTVDDTFYAGIFTMDEDGAYELYQVVELIQNDTVRVQVPLGGENGTEPITYYVYETDENGEMIDPEVFAYGVSGEGEVILTPVDNIAGVDIINEVTESQEVSLILRKVDENHVGLAGASFSMTNADGEIVEEWVSDGEGTELILEPGTYTLEELEAPEGYQGSDEVVITVSQDGDISIDSNAEYTYEDYELEYVNRPAKRVTVAPTRKESAKTGDDTPIQMYLMLLFAAAGIAGGIIYKKKRIKN